MISLAIANYNRVEMTIESFIQVLDNDLVGEIVIVDDYSDINIYAELWNKIQELHTDKVFLLRNAENKGAFLNKYEAVKKCTGDWVILLDCDNKIDNDYIEKVNALDKKQDTLYCPEVIYSLHKTKIQWLYKEFNTLVLDKWNIKSYIEDKLFGTCMNTGNFFFNRQEYLDVVELSRIDKRLYMLDSFYFNYLWLAKSNKMVVVPDLYYEHRIHDGSYYLKNKNNFVKIHRALVENVKAL
jgi:glycosyltransferase involved in cell wall biosynthesis